MQSHRWEERFQLQKQQIRDGQAELITMAKALAAKTNAFDSIIHKVHHDINSYPKRFRGLVTIIGYPLTQAKQQTIQACKPGHHKWAKLALTNLEEVEELHGKMETVCLDLESKMTNTVKEFEHLQSE